MFLEARALGDLELPEDSELGDLEIFFEVLSNGELFSGSVSERNS